VTEHRDVVAVGEVIGQHFLNLDLGLPFERLRPLLRGVLGSDGASGEVSVDAVNRRGPQVMVRVAGTRLHNYADGLDGDGAIIVMEADAGPSPERV
jgi:two-component system CheB/CheR fusion protein